MGSNKTPSTNHRAQLGKLGEDIAATHVQQLGWHVLQRNWRNRYGELDLIVADGSTLIIVEVKTRSTDMYDDPAQAVTPTKLTRMRNLTRMWLAEQDEFWPDIRFDVISIKVDLMAPSDGYPVEIRHHRGVYV